MSNLVVLTFDDMEQAGKALIALKEVQKTGNYQIDDSAVIVKDEAGKIKVKNTTETAVKVGAVGGGLLGLVLASVFFPLAGIAIGAAAGGLIGKSLDTGIDKKFVKEVTETLKPGSSALFIIGSKGNPAVVFDALRPFQGTIYQTTLPTELVDQLKDALK